MSNIVTSLGNIVQGILNLPSLIVSGIGDFFTTLFGWLGLIIDAIKELPSAILNVLKEIFVPDSENINALWMDTVDRITAKFGFLRYDINDVFRSELPVDNVNAEYNISGLGVLTIPIMDTKFLLDGVAFFKPLIRGFLALMIILYNIRQFMSFFSLDSGISGGTVSTYSNYKEYKDKEG